MVGGIYPTGHLSCSLLLALHPHLLLHVTNLLLALVRANLCCCCLDEREHLGGMGDDRRMA